MGMEGKSGNLPAEDEQQPYFGIGARRRWAAVVGLLVAIAFVVAGWLRYDASQPGAEIHRAVSATARPEARVDALMSAAPAVVSTSWAKAPSGTVRVAQVPQSAAPTQQASSVVAHPVSLANDELSPYRGAAVDPQTARQAVVYSLSGTYGETLAEVGSFTLYDLAGREDMRCYCFSVRPGFAPEAEQVKRLASELQSRGDELRIRLGALNGDARERAEATLRDLRFKAELADDFVFAYSGAHRGHVPVVTMSRGIPPFYRLAERARAAVAAKAGPSARFDRVLALGPLEEGYEFEVGGTRWVYIARTEETVQWDELLSKTKAAGKAVLARMESEPDLRSRTRVRSERLDAKWNLITKLVK